MYLSLCPTILCFVFILFLLFLLSFLLFRVYFIFLHFPLPRPSLYRVVFSCLLFISFCSSLSLSFPLSFSRTSPFIPSYFPFYPNLYFLYFPSSLPPFLVLSHFFALPSSPFFNLPLTLLSPLLFLLFLFPFSILFPFWLSHFPLSPLSLSFHNSSLSPSPLVLPSPFLPFNSLPSRSPFPSPPLFFSFPTHPLSLSPHSPPLFLPLPSLPLPFLPSPVSE